MLIIKTALTLCLFEGCFELSGLKLTIVHRRPTLHMETTASYKRVVTDMKNKIAHFSNHAWFGRK